MSQLPCHVERSETSLSIAAGEEFKYELEILLPRLRDQNDIYETF
jgi:hypothetical protein